jgi:hypothetical protein
MPSLRALFGYPTSWGNKRTAIAPVAGPVSYVQVTAVAGTVPILGGQVIAAGQFGMKALDQVLDGVTDDGCFAVRAIPVTDSSNPNAAAATYRLQWIALVTATIGGQNQTAGSEAITATDLSAEIVRLLAIGPN